MNLDDYNWCDCPVCEEEIAVDVIVSENHHTDSTTLNKYFQRELKCPTCNAMWTESWLLVGLSIGDGQNN